MTENPTWLDRDVTIVALTLPLEKLSLFKQAATQSGYELDVTAREGDPFTLWINFGGGWEEKTAPVKPGKVGITLKRPSDHENHSPFWRALEQLEKAS